jgi:hypothetical protein
MMRSHLMRSVRAMRATLGLMDDVLEAAKCLARTISGEFRGKFGRYFDALVEALSRKKTKANIVASRCRRALP